VSEPRWSPDGYRIAYRSESDLRVVTGDNAQDWLLARRVPAAPAAWKPLAAPREQVLAFARGTRVRIVEVDSRRLLGVTPPGPLPREIWWADRGRRLVTVDAHSVRLHTATGRLLRTIDIPLGSVVGSAIAPRGHRLALIARAPSRSWLLLQNLDRPAAPRRLLESRSTFEGLAWSGDGSRIVVGRPRADQWLFVPPDDSAGLQSVRAIRAKFQAADDPAGDFPRPAGWCFAQPVDRSTSGQPPCLPGAAR
jgi:hypothetical protein